MDGPPDPPVVERFTLSIYIKLVPPETLIIAICTAPRPLYAVRSMVSLRHCVLVGVNTENVLGAVARAVPVLVYTRLKVTPQLLLTTTASVSKLTVFHA